MLSREYIIEDYYKISFVGKGLNGIVYEAKNDSNEHVAIKKIKIEENFSYMNEIEILNILSNDCFKYFLCIKKCIKDKHNLYIITEYLKDYIPLSKVKLNKFIQNNYISISEEILKTIINNLYEGLKLMHFYKI